jgi:hypothetical protein
MSEVKRIIALVVIPGDTSQCVRNESYLLRSRSLRTCGRRNVNTDNSFRIVFSAHRRRLPLDDGPLSIFIEDRLVAVLGMSAPAPSQRQQSSRIRGWIGPAEADLIVNVFDVPHTSLPPG